MPLSVTRIMKPFYTIFAVAFFSMLAIYPIFVDSKVVSQSACYTWNQFSQNLPIEKNTPSGQWGRFGNLPPEFQNGCVLLSDNNAVDVAYILNSSINSDAFMQRPSNPRQKAPTFSNETSEKLELLVSQGKAVKVIWYTATNASFAYWRSAPRDRAFQGNQGEICFNQICMKSGSISDRDLAKILSVR